MRVGVISDIHGNLPALDAALRLLERDLAVDTVVCCGDLVDRGTDAAGVIARIQERGIPTVMGNHDESAPRVERSLRDNPDRRAFYNAPHLTDAEIIYLESLPPTLTFEWVGVRVFMAHGSPWNNETYIMPNALRKVILRVLAESAASVTLLGHTHQPVQFTVGEQIICNSGAVGGAYGLHRGKHTCGVLELPSRTFTVYDALTGESLRVPNIKHPPP